MREKRIRLTRATCTPDQLRCWAAVSELVGGDHHLGGPVYACADGIEVSWCGDIATYDHGYLSRMVLIAHRDAVRFSLSNGGPRRLKIMIYPREHGHDSWARKHPTLDDLIEAATKMKGAAHADLRES